MSKTKAELIEEAKALHLDVDSDQTKAEIQEAIDEKKAGDAVGGEAVPENAAGEAPVEPTEGGEEGAGAAAVAGEPSAEPDPADDDDGAVTETLPGTDGEPHGDDAVDPAAVTEPDGLPEPEPVDLRLPAGMSEEDARAIANRAHDCMTGPIIAAYYASCAVFAAFQRSEVRPIIDEEWINPGEWLLVSVVMVNIIAPFVRQYPTAPAEALYIHTLDTAPAELELEPVKWAELPFPERLAWETFRDVLVRSDAAVKAEDARLEGLFAASGQRPRAPVDPEDLTLETQDEPFALSDSGKAMMRRG